MIVVDSAIWIEHHHKNIAPLHELMALRGAMMHPFVLAEIALGNLRSREAFITFAHDLPEPPLAESGEVLNLIVNAKLEGSGIGYVDAHLLASTMLVPGGRLWTRDRRLGAAADKLGISYR